MKKSIFILPLIALGLFLGTSSASARRQSASVDVEEIRAAVNEAIQETFAEMDLNDTIFQSGIAYASLDSAGNVNTVINPVVPEIKVNVNTGDEWISEREEQRTVIAVVSIVIPCVMITIIVALVLLFFYYRMRNRNKVIETAINAGYHLPTEFYTNNSLKNSHDTAESGLKSTPADGTVPPPLPRDIRSRTAGFRLVAIGVGLMIMFGVWGGLDVAVLGVIPFLIGASYLASYYNILK
ncbi:MAG: DUF6249 domain-containing protein [Muribaculaceae bacterium]|nr:DUF6249 domain-containing protein [Muribaculaceae bacterium]